MPPGWAAVVDLGHERHVLVRDCQRLRMLVSDAAEVRVAGQHATAVREVYDYLRGEDVLA